MRWWLPPGLCLTNVTLRSREVIGLEVAVPGEVRGVVQELGLWPLLSAAKPLCIRTGAGGLSGAERPPLSDPSVPFLWGVLECGPVDPFPGAGRRRLCTPKRGGSDASGGAPFWAGGRLQEEKGGASRGAATDPLSRAPQPPPPRGRCRPRCSCLKHPQDLPVQVAGVPRDSRKMVQGLPGEVSPHSFLGLL